MKTLTYLLAFVLVAAAALLGPPSPSKSEAVSSEGFMLPWPKDAGSTFGTGTFKVNQGPTGYSHKCPRDASAPHTGDYFNCNAVDFGLPVGTPVLAVQKGKVEFVKSGNGEGKCDPTYANKANEVHIRHEDGSVTFYLHLSDVGVAKDQEIERGALIGLSGKSGYVCGPHLHFQRRLGDQNLVPNFFEEYLGTTLDYPMKVTSRNQTSGWPSGTASVIDVALIIDSSGSMSWNDLDNQRLNAARTYLVASAPDDKVAVVDFDDSARLASGLLVARPGNTGNPALQQAIGTIDSSGNTNIRAGIETACQELTAHGQAPKRGAILLTDGEHNIGSFGSPQTCFKQNGWPIYTFGFGSAGESLLRQIASDTGGEFKYLPTSDLVCEFQYVRARIAGVTPGPCAVSLVLPARTTSLLASVPASQSQATFSTSWPGSDVVMSLVTPSGRVIDRNTNTPDVIHDVGATFEVYTVVDPEPGDWRVDLFGADVLPQGEETVFGFSTLPSAVIVIPPAADSEPPVTNASADPEPNINGWNNTDVTVTLTATDDNSGVMETHYASDSLVDTVVAGDFAQVTLTDEGVHNVVYWAVDNVGNIASAASIQVRIDKTAPEVMVQFVRGKPHLTSADGSPTVVEPSVITERTGTYSLTDAAGNATDMTLYSGRQICRVGYRLGWCGMVRLKSISENGGPESILSANRLVGHKSGDRTWAEIAGQGELRTRFDAQTGETIIEKRRGPWSPGGETTVRQGHWSAVLSSDGGSLSSDVVRD